jgi:hypothetical protein
MKIVCAHCQAEGKPGILGEMEPQEDIGGGSHAKACTGD